MAIKIYGDGKALTANQFAKWILFDKTETAFYFDGDEHGKMTDKERNQVINCMQKQQDRIHKLLGIDKINK